MSVPIEDQIICVQREIKFRDRTYPRWVRENKLTIENCTIEMERIHAVLGTLKRLRVEQAFVPEHRGLTEADIRRDEREKVLAVVTLHTASNIMVKIGKQLPALAP